MNKQYAFKLNKKVIPTNADAIEYSMKYEGDEAFFKRCINIAKEDGLFIELLYEWSIFNVFKPKDIRHYQVSISEYWRDEDLSFHYFLIGKESIRFEEPEEALVFEKLASNTIENWLNSQWIKYEKIQDIIANPL